MSDKPSSPAPSAAQAETAEDVFARIQRRRGDTAELIHADDAQHASDAGEPLPGKGHATVGETDEVLPPDDAPLAGRRVGDEHQAYDDIGVRHLSAANLDDYPGQLLPVLRQPDDPGFPRSKTFRFLLRNPELAILAAIPVAQLALRSRTLRRAAYQAGKFKLKQHAWKQVRRLTDI
ncbi:MAG: hypothetical protein Q4E06_09595 [Lautropia sp.]|nr:hypothetical protein [Lautropia sp.]